MKYVDTYLHMGASNKKVVSGMNIVCHQCNNFATFDNVTLKRVISHKDPLLGTYNFFYELPHVIYTCKTEFLGVRTCSSAACIKCENPLTWKVKINKNGTYTCDRCLHPPLIEN